MVTFELMDATLVIEKAHGFASLIPHPKPRWLLYSRAVLVALG